MPCADPESFFRGGPTLSMVFLRRERGSRYHKKRANIGPVAKRHFAGGPIVAQHNTLNARLKDLLFFRGSGPVLLRNPIFLSFSRGSGPPVPPLDPHMHVQQSSGDRTPLCRFRSSSTGTH